MTFTPITWTDGTTPVNASNLNRIEAGLSNAADEINSATSTVNSALVRITNSVSSNSSTTFIYSEGQVIASPSACLILVGGQTSVQYGCFLVQSYGYSSVRTHISDLGSGSAITCEALDDDYGVIVSNSSNASVNAALIVLMGSTPTITRL